MDIIKSEVEIKDEISDFVNEKEVFDDVEEEIIFAEPLKQEFTEVQSEDLYRLWQRQHHYKEI
ncbi:hypothetical protein Anas_12627 [Armadillidium nasatum]|uniref:Uncharacterized protein n=1 Tax=Armadillidium nasatum TaxID=96803 RepID=A0A5N5T8T2_9CRUS|nr:hypothetical protein Anas_12627 [Armadillidium nasatum]